MRYTAIALPLLIVACVQPAQRVAVAPAIAVVDIAEPAPPATNPAVGGVALPPSANLATNIAAAPTLATLFRLGTYGPMAILAATGPYTLFAPTDEAFSRLAPGTEQALQRPENRSTLTKLVTLHVVAGRVSSAELVRRVAAGGGRATLTSVAGETLAVTMTGNIITLTDSGGNKSYVEIADVRSSNGVMHVVNGVLVPRLP